MRVALWILGIPFAAVVAWDFYLGVSLGRPHPFLPVILGAVAFAALFHFVILPWTAQRAHRDETGLSLAGELSAEGLVDAGGTATWSLFRQWRASDKIILLYSSPDRFVMIPLRTFASESDRAAALALLERHLGNAG